MTMESDGMLKADGFDAAIIGTATPWQNQQQEVFIYDAIKCIEILAENMDCAYEEAEEYFHFNVAGAYVGEQTPIFVWPQREE